LYRGERCSRFLTVLPLCLRDGVVCTRPRRRGVPIGARAVVDGTDPEGRTALHVACGLPDPPRTPQDRGGGASGREDGGAPTGTGTPRGGGVGSGDTEEGASVGGACQGSGGAPGFCSSGSEAHGNIEIMLVFKVGPSPRVESPPPGSIWVQPNSGGKNWGSLPGEIFPDPYFWVPRDTPPPGGGGGTCGIEGVRK